MKTLDKPKGLRELRAIAKTHQLTVNYVGGWIARYPRPDLDAWQEERLSPYAGTERDALNEALERFTNERL